ncbi:BTB/POZ domain-containing protein [Ditylenchus destructor]|nr:BTB/POZ domain-containing protein [Ditylenchus destructor]
MNVEKESYKVANVSKQITKVTPLFAKLEWRVENFEKLMRLTKEGRAISSEVFTYPYLESIKWQLSIYPNGTSEEKNSGPVFRRPCYKSPCPGFFLHEIGQKTSDSIMADFKIYALCANKEKLDICQKVCEFAEDGKGYGAHVDKPAIAKALQDDGSLLVICEVEFLAPEETYSMAKVPHPNIVCPELGLLRNIGDMWKKQLCTDCNLQVGEKNFPAHKCILSQWSLVFRSMFLHPTEEAMSGIVVISDFSSESVGAMLEYMYTGEVKTEVMRNLNTELLTLADKYALTHLKRTCEIFTASMIDKTNVLEAAVVADMHLSKELKKACANHLAIHGREVLKTPLWKQLKSKKKNLANELLELVIRDHPSFSDIEAKKEDSDSD